MQASSDIPHRRRIQQADRSDYELDIASSAGAREPSPARRRDGRETDSDTLSNAPEQRRGTHDDRQLSMREVLEVSQFQGAMEAQASFIALLEERAAAEDQTRVVMSLLRGQEAQRVVETYVGGILAREDAQLQPEPVEPKFGFIFLPGSDLPTVTRQEQRGINAPEPEQKDPRWRVATASGLLSDVRISEDMLVMSSDQSAEIVRRVSDRHGADPKKRDALARQSASEVERRRGAVLRPDARNQAIRIDSDRVRIVRDLRNNPFDVAATLIEVDQTSMLNLMFRCRHLLAVKGRNMAPIETKHLLETMVEDARCLCVRSPILFRMSTRRSIMLSKNTHYGYDSQSRFETITTSKGIKEILLLGAAYFNALDPDVSRGDLQTFIRPRFLQMVVLLLAFLNNDDLDDIQDFLQDTYGIKADRQHLEILFLRVLPLASINSNIFMRALVHTVDNTQLPHPSTQEALEMSQYWKIFIRELMQKGYLLPGCVEDLNHPRDSWIVGWPKDNVGIKSSKAFRRLQFAAPALRTFNDIPPFELHPEETEQRLTVDLMNDMRVEMNRDDLEAVTLMLPGIYQVMHGEAVYDLQITDRPLNSDITAAVQTSNELIRRYNEWQVENTREKKRFSIMSPRAPPLELIASIPSFGVVTEHQAILSHHSREVIARAYKLDGRKIARLRAAGSIMQSIGSLRHFVDHIDKRCRALPLSSELKRLAKSSLDRVREALQEATKTHERLKNIRPEAGEHHDIPIFRTLFAATANVGAGASAVWHPYTTHIAGDHLFITARYGLVTQIRWIAAQVAEVKLDEASLQTHTVETLQPVEHEQDRAAEISRGDVGVLVGSYMAICTAAGDNSYTMANWLAIVSTVEEALPRRAMNSMRPSEPRIIKIR